MPEGDGTKRSGQARNAIDALLLGSLRVASCLTVTPSALSERLFKEFIADARPDTDKATCHEIKKPTSRPTRVDSRGRADGPSGAVGFVSMSEQESHQ